MKGNKISDYRNQIPALTLGNLLFYIPTSENRLSDVGMYITDFLMLV